jgi:hypothetical protein
MHSAAPIPYRYLKLALVHRNHNQPHISQTTQDTHVLHRRGFFLPVGSGEPAPSSPIMHMGDCYDKWNVMMCGMFLEAFSSEQLAQKAS